MRTTWVTVTAVAWAALAGPPVAAQGRSATARAVDRVVAVVGTKPILASQVEEQLVLAQSQGAKVPEDSAGRDAARRQDRKSTRLNSSHLGISYAVFCLKKKNNINATNA